MATLCLSGSAIVKAGNNAPVIAPASYYDEFINQAEGVVCAATRYNWVDAYATIDADLKYVLEGVVSDLAAIYIIQYKLTGEDGTKDRIEAEDQINVLRDSALRGISILRDKKTQTFMGV